MSRRRTIEDITRRNVETIAKLQSAAAGARTVGEKLADLAVKWVGSWTFLIIQSVLLIVWMMLNVFGWIKHWDPYPFVLLNLVLSFQAAFATPIILMSENRQARLDERRNHLDLQINLLAEQENTEQLRLLQLLCEHAGIRINDPDFRALEGVAKPDSIIQQIIETVETTTPGKGR